MNKDESFLKVFENRSEYVTNDGTEVFAEGKVCTDAKRRAKAVKDAFEAGFLDELVEDLKTSPENQNFDDLGEEVRENIAVLVDSVTSEVGRALVGLTFMQLSIKSISPDQNIRLHKAGTSGSSFSWVDGIPMRALDKAYVTPFLRRHNLLRLNADGFMMTRSLAENYPYTKLYKAKLRGARDQWLRIVEILEREQIDASRVLRYLVSRLLNKAADFDVLASTLLIGIDKYLSTPRAADEIRTLIRSHVDDSDYAARLMEVAMHSLMQAVMETGALGLTTLKPLSQMRSANKKHGNIGDIELLENGEIVEAWDAKYGKSYLRDEIDELSEKLEQHDKATTVGFVITDSLQRVAETTEKIEEVEQLFGVDLLVLSLDDWIQHIIDRSVKTGMVSAESLSKKWLIAYAETLSQRRRKVAPIDEPCFNWVSSLNAKL